jgi:ABC-2 type transport system permease protein
VSGSLQRIGAMVRRHGYLFAKSWPRLISLIYYPTLQMVLWGLVSRYLAPTNQLVQDIPGLFISAVLLWELLMRAQLGVSLSFFEELYSRNLANLFVAPLRAWEYVASMLVMSTLRTLFSVGGAGLIAWLAFKFDITQLGWSLPLYITLLMMFGWAVGFAVSGLVLKWGLGAEELAWGAIFLIMPLSCVYYPLATLPTWVQPIALALPTTPVFESMRFELAGKGVQWHYIWQALGLNVLYIGGAIALYFAAIRIAKRDGQLMQMGE